MKKPLKEKDFNEMLQKIFDGGVRFLCSTNGDHDLDDKDEGGVFKCKKCGQKMMISGFLGRTNAA